ncbi:hypothetical protein SLS57_011309 [Botryosphaeria dothidea]
MSVDKQIYYLRKNGDRQHWFSHPVARFFHDPVPFDRTSGRLSLSADTVTSDKWDLEYIDATHGHGILIRHRNTGRLVGRVLGHLNASPADESENESDFESVPGNLPFARRHPYKSSSLRFIKISQTTLNEDDKDPAWDDHEARFSEPVLTIGLRQGNSFGNDMLQLHRPSFAGLNNVEITTFEAQRTVPLVCSGLDEKARRLDLIAALRAGLLELIEQDSQQIVRVAHAPQPVYRIEIPPKPSPAWRQSRVGLGIDSTAPFWKDTLQPGKAYALRFSADGGEAWCFHTDSTGSENLPVRREPDTVTFTVHDDPAPPTFSAALSVEPGTASRSGIPPFRFVVYIASEADEPVTVCTVHTPFGGELNCVDQLVRCVDIETGEEVEFPAQFGCFTEDPSPEFPEDSRFVEVWPGKQWHFEHTLDELSDRTLGGLECLESGRSMRFKNDKLTHGRER